jgi:hypothetical protein
VGTDEDGRHKWVQTVATNDADSTLTTNVARATGMDLVYFSRFKTAVEATANQDCQPYVKNLGAALEATPYPLGVMQLLGIRAMAVFDVVQAAPYTVSIVYGHNASAITFTLDLGVPNIYTLTFTNALPTANYLVLGGVVCANATSDAAYFVLPSAGALTNTKSTTSVKFQFKSVGSTASRTPLQGWIVVFGG